MSPLSIRRLSATLAVACACSLLSGCYLTSPLWSQNFPNTSAQIPIQAYALSANVAVTFECAQASHGGLYPPFEDPVWHQIAVRNSGANGMFDPQGNEIFAVGLKTALPAACWREDYHGTYYAAVRARQAAGSLFDGFYFTFDAAGFECLNVANGAAGSLVGAVGAECHKAYSNTGNKIPFVIITAG